MAYKDKFSERIEIDIPDTATELVMKVIMQEGELRFREKLTTMLLNELTEIRETDIQDPGCTFADGISYVLHLLREVDFNE